VDFEKDFRNYVLTNAKTEPDVYGSVNLTAYGFDSAPWAMHPRRYSPRALPEQSSKGIWFFATSTAVAVGS
jgi:hypothetical protein